jgi:hypothetical protein
MGDDNSSPPSDDVADMGNDTTPSSDWLSSTFSAFGNLAGAAAPLVSTLTGKKVSTSPTTAGTAAASSPVGSTLYIVLGIGAAILVAILFLRKR